MKKLALSVIAGVLFTSAQSMASGPGDIGSGEGQCSSIEARKLLVDFLNRKQMDETGFLTTISVFVSKNHSDAVDSDTGEPSYKFNYFTSAKNSKGVVKHTSGGALVAKDCKSGDFSGDDSLEQIK